MHRRVGKSLSVDVQAKPNFPSIIKLAYPHAKTIIDSKSEKAEAHLQSKAAAELGSWHVLLFCLIFFLVGYYTMAISAWKGERVFAKREGLRNIPKDNIQGRPIRPLFIAYVGKTHLKIGSMRSFIF